MTTLQIEFTEDELLADHPIAEPLVVDGVRCHGGFTEDGEYVSPRTANRWPAIQAWEAHRQEQFGTPVLDIPLDSWPEHFPSVEQSSFLLEKGVRSPVIEALTRVGTVEGFGGILRSLPVPDMQRCFEEDVTGTAIAHIDGGLFEAQARDEAGFGDLAGHDRMWFAARDVAFERPPVEDLTARMLSRMGITPGEPRRRAAAERALPEDIDPALETLVLRMVGLLLIEISAYHTFAWAEAVLDRRDLVAGDGAGSRLVSYIRADESSHVAWLRTALSEMRDRTWVGTDKTEHAGTDMVGRVWDRAVADSRVARRQDNLDLAMAEIELALDGRPDGDDVIAEMLAMGTVVRGPDGRVHDAPTPVDGASTDGAPTDGRSGGTVGR